MPANSEPAPHGWLFDANIMSELRKAARCGRNLAAWATRVPRSACFLSRVTVAEA